MSGSDETTKPEGPPSAIGLRQGTVVGRYVIVQPLGRGGTSQVMLAHDTQLARNVAIKVLLTDFASEGGRLRMMREAQAMAQLSHPNVVPIFDVGTHEGNIYLAMEYVDGETMYQWLRTPRSWREVLGVMKQAGRGLAAAHAAGIVHRDFKPANVVIARDGRVKVLDFGIARLNAVSASSTPDLVAERPRPHAARVVEARSSDPSAAELTEEGVFIGTLGYVAPEMAFEQTADARSDVFSFCVTLWRALYGAPPFSTASLDAYLEAIASDRLETTPAGRRVPAWLHEAARSGLHSEPARRPASMEVVLRALDADPSRARVVRGAAVLGVLAIAAAATGVVRHRRAVRAECEAEGSAAAAGWDASRRQQVRSALLDDAGARPSDRADRVLRGLDDYVAAWRDAQQSSCEATRVTQTQTPAMHERRTACLLGARQQLEVAVELLGEHDPMLRKKAPEVLQALPPPRLCSGRDVENAFVPLPTDPGARAKAEEARRLTVRARVLDASGRRDEALAVAGQARALARDSGVTPDEAAAVLVLATVLTHKSNDSAARHAALEATMIAERSGADRVAGLAASLRAVLLSGRLSQLDEARDAVDYARAKLARLGGDVQLELSILASGVLVEAKARNWARSLEDSDKLIARELALYGKESHLVCGHTYNRALTLMDVPDLEGAIAGLREALSCFEASTSPEDPWLGAVRQVLASALRRSGRLEEARAEAGRVAELRASQGSDDPVVAANLMEVAMIDELEGHHADAELVARRSLVMAERQSGWIAEQVPNGLAVLGFARLAVGDAAEARADCARGLALLEPIGLPSPDRLCEADVLRCVGEAELSLGDVEHARAHLERSVALPMRWEIDDLPRARLALARALVAPPRPDHARAAALAEQARDELRAASGTRPWLQPLLDDTERWLAQERASAARH